MAKGYFDCNVRRRTGNVELKPFDDARLFAKAKLENLFNGVSPDVVFNTLEMAVVQPKSTAHQMKVFRMYVPMLLDMYDAVHQCLMASCRQVDELQGSFSERARKRYTKDEDEIIIELAARGDTLIAIALAVGRTPTAIQSRISHLVGIGKISEEIAGRFIGTLNGDFVDGYIDGVLYKNEGEEDDEQDS